MIYVPMRQREKLYLAECQTFSSLKTLAAADSPRFICPHRAEFLTVQVTGNRVNAKVIGLFAVMPFVTFSGSQIKTSIFQDERQSKPGLSNGRWSGKACGRYSLDREAAGCKSLS